MMTVRLIVDPVLSLDAPLRLRVEGMEPGGELEITASLVDDEGAAWRSGATFHADKDGVVDILKHAPLSGTWRGVDPDGLFWSMAPCHPDEFDDFRRNGAKEYKPGMPSPHRSGMPTLLSSETWPIKVEARIDGQTVADTEISRRFIPPGLIETPLSEGRLRGVLFQPAESGDYPGVVFISGSEGGIKRVGAALLAAHGFSVLALGYFNAPDLPSHHVRIPLEYFIEGFDWLQQKIGHSRIGIIGGSRGGEGVLALATHFPDRVKAAVAMVPGDLYTATYMGGGPVEPAWTLDGADLPAAWGEAGEDAPPDPTKPVNTHQTLFQFYYDEEVYRDCAIPIERMQCPVLFISGADDQTWPSHHASLRAVKRLADTGYAHAVEHIWDPKAGHAAGTPGFPTVMSDSAIHPVEPIFFTLGGTPEGNARHIRRSWDGMITFLKRELA